MPGDGRFVAEATFHVRYAETDAMGIVHHASYVVWFEEGRSHYARARGSDYADFERSGHYLTVAEVSARYLKPMVYGTRVSVRCWIETMQSRALTFAYQILNADTGDVCVTGQSKHVCITHDGRVTTLPAQWRAWGST
ncbi:MAG: thioesterase family protein [Chloroflexota bacterium]|nr:thioesterase family protein [Chloroflexota bacterium]